MIFPQKYSEIKLGIVCPMANEKQSAERFVSEVLFVCNSFQFKSVCFYASLDKASQDGTLKLLSDLSQRNPQLRIVYCPENKNVVDAYKRGYQEAIVDNVDWILEIDAGFSHKPQDIPQFFQFMMEGGYGCVFGSRFHRGGKIKNCSLKRWFISLGGTYLANILLGTKLKDMTSGFELFQKEALVWILNKEIRSQGPFFQTEIRAFAHKFKITEVPIFYDAGTPHFRRGVILDSFRQLSRLLILRLKGQLFK